MTERLSGVRAAIWEPWCPEVGQRVLVRHSAECQHTHLIAPVGAVATVVEILWSRDDDGHAYAIQYEDRSIGESERVCVGDYVCADDWLCALELEALV